MKTREDWTLSLRMLWAHPLESLLLVLGLAIAIGATTSGLAMVEKARVDGDALLQLPEYREIVVSSRESSDQMTTPVVLTQDETVTLSIDDLEAAQLSPDIEFAYLAERTRLRFNTSDFNFAPPDAPPETSDTNSNPNSAAPDINTEDTATNERPPMEFASVEGPQPQLDEVSGYSVTTDYFSAMNLTIADGSLFTEADLLQGNKVVVLGAELAKTLFADGENLNRQLASFTNIYTIIGTLQPTGTTLDAMVFMPSRLAQDNTGALAFRGPGGGNNTTLHFAVSDASKLNAAAEQLSSWFDTTYGVGNTATSVPRSAVEQAIDRKEKTALMTLILALAGLLIANVNVSNILYSRAIRRRKQVGILMALGASRRHIFNLFLGESGVVVSLGALAGMAIAFGFSALLMQSGSDGALPVYAIVLGMLAAAGIALLFTLVPAVYAARIPPAVAIRVE
ncbi:MAG: ABC transporter permease [Reinekea sp.]|nr:ABC transporter permease [Reinekea sp.]MDX1473635.1 ABC transporter permease [Reinekea sp.]